VLTGASAATAWWLDGGEPQAEATQGSEVPHLDGKTIVLPPAFERRAGIRTTDATRGRLQPRLRVVGIAAFDPEYVAAVGTKARGFVRSIKHFEGDVVAPGDVLAEIESSELAEAQAQLAVADAHLLAAERDTRREQGLLSQGMTARRDVEVAEARRAEQHALRAAARQRVASLARGDEKPLGIYALRAPLGGTVVERQIHQGQAVDDNLTAFRVADLHRLWIELQLSERFLNAVHPGDIVEIQAVAGNQAMVKGRVAHVGDVLDPATGTATVRVEVLDAQRLIRPGQSVTAAILPAESLHDTLLVPMGAVTHVDGKPTVFLQKAPHRIEPVEVVLGAEDGQSREIVQGLQTGDRIVSEGVFELKSELFR
jgi:cobalt-zinc-cadmium efflux system membrane fusion protein